MKTTPRYELFGTRTGNCLRAAIALHEAGIEYQVRHVDLRSGDQKSRSFLGLNPAGKVPVLKVTESGKPDQVITQSNAIILYADELAPGRLLPSTGSVHRSRVLEAFFYFVTDVIASNGVAFSLDATADANAIQVLTTRYIDRIAAAERLLSASGYMGGADFSIADIAGFTIVTAVKRQLAWDRLPQLAAWVERIAERPNVQAGLAAFNL
jgi:GSH-dependent disulfide-bond oxidoreductase